MSAKPPIGFTIIELMVVVTTIGLVALLGIPEVRFAAERTEATVAANDLRVFAEALEFFSTAEGTYPDAMTYTRMPEEVEGFLPTLWKNGSYSWYYVNTDDFIYIYVYNLGFNAEQTVRLDRILDDGNISTGDIRRGLGGNGVVYLFAYEDS